MSNNTFQIGSPSSTKNIDILNTKSNNSKVNSKVVP